jgi:hypothetical protein
VRLRRSRDGEKSATLVHAGLDSISGAPDSRLAGCAFHEAQTYTMRSKNFVRLWGDRRPPRVPLSPGLSTLSAETGSEASDPGFDGSVAVCRPSERLFGRACRSDRDSVCTVEWTGRMPGRLLNTHAGTDRIAACRSGQGSIMVFVRHFALLSRLTADCQLLRSAALSRTPGLGGRWRGRRQPARAAPPVGVSAGAVSNTRSSFGVLFAIGSDSG